MIYNTTKYFKPKYFNDEGSKLDMNFTANNSLAVDLYDAEEKDKSLSEAYKKTLKSV